MILIILIALMVIEVAALILLLKIAGEKKSLKKEKLKVHHYLVFFMYFVAGLFVVYLVGSVYLPDLMKPINSGNYELSLENPVNSLSSLYFDKDIFSDVVDGSILVDSEKIVNLVFKPKKIIEKGREIEVLIEGVNDGTEVYFEDKLIIPDLSSYTKVRDFENGPQGVPSQGGQSVWVRNDYEYGELISKSSVEDYIYFNFPGSSVYSFKELDKGIPILTDWDSTETKIDTTFRHELRLKVYHGGGILSLGFTKQDLNVNNGKDEYTLTITDLEGIEWYKKVYEDDGDKKDSNKLGEEEDYKLDINLERGIYTIYFDRDENNKWEDSTIKDIKIGSNKVLIVGSILPWEGFNFYTKIYGEENIKFRTYWRDEFDVKITGDESRLFEVKKGEDYFLDLLKGEYYLSNSKGKTWISRFSVFSPSKENWFDLPAQGERKLNLNDVLIIDKNLLIINGNKITAKIKTEIKDETSKYKFQVLDENKFKLEFLEVRC